MVLSSQMSRPGATGRPNMFAKKRRRSRQGPTVVVCLVLILASVYWFWWRDSGGGSGDGGGGGENLQAALGNPGGSGDSESEGGESMLPRGQGETVTNERVESGAGQANTPTAITMGDQNGGRGTDENDPQRQPEDPQVTPTPGGGDDLRGGPGVGRSVGSGDVGADPAAEVQQLMASADEYRARGQLVEARQLFSDALQHPQVGRAAAVIRAELQAINETLVFSPHIAENDPFTRRHVIGDGDRMVFLARDAKVDYRLLGRINNLADPGKIRLGQSVKIIEGPFHAVVDKSDYRMDVYLGAADELGRRIYVRSFSVGLGEFNSTPSGSWVVRKNSKAINPAWTNPRTGESFDANDPANPIGEFWIGLEGIDNSTKLMRGYGIHGTIDPSSIGRQASMGCVRMHDADVALVYELLTTAGSTVITQP